MRRLKNHGTSQVASLGFPWFLGRPIADQGTTRLCAAPTRPDGRLAGVLGTGTEPSPTPPGAQPRSDPCCGGALQGPPPNLPTLVSASPRPALLRPVLPASVERKIRFRPLVLLVLTLVFGAAALYGCGTVIDREKLQDTVQA